MKQKIKKVLFYGFPINSDKDEMFSKTRKNSFLIEGIRVLNERFQDQEIEVFETRDNLLVAENGYHFAVFEEDVAGAVWEVKFRLKGDPVIKTENVCLFFKKKSDVKKWWLENKAGRRFVSCALTNP